MRLSYVESGVWRRAKGEVPDYSCFPFLKIILLTYNSNSKIFLNSSDFLNISLLERKIYIFSILKAALSFKNRSVL